MKKLFSMILMMTILLSLSNVAMAAEKESGFSDIPTGWSHDAVVAAIENGLLLGNNGKVNPGGFLKRSEMAAILVRAFGGTEKADISAFNDVFPDRWYYNELSVAVQMGIFKGNGTGLRPDDYITREQAALVLSRAFRLTDADIDLSGYTDANKVSAWARDGVAAVVKAGYMKGDGTYLLPLHNITREQFAQLMYNLISGYITVPGEVAAVPKGNVMIRAAGTTLDGITADGDVIIGDGVGNGDVTLKNCTLNGRLLVRGGGANSIYIINSQLSGSVTVSRTDGAVHVSIDGKSAVPAVEVTEAADKAILSGSFKELAVNGNSEVVLRNAAVENVTVSANDANLTVEKNSTVSSIEVASSGVDVVVAGKVTSVSVGTAAEGTSISGTGKVENVTAQPGSAQTSVDTAGTTIVNTSDAPITTSGSAIAAGTTGKTGAPSGGDGGGGDSTSPTYYTLTLSITDGSNTVTATTGGGIHAGTTRFYAQAAALLTETKRTELRTAFDDTAARDVLNSGLSSYEDDTAWTAFKTNYFIRITGSDIALFGNRTVTLAELTGTRTLTYSAAGKTYTVTISITGNS